MIALIVVLVHALHRNFAVNHSIKTRPYGGFFVAKRLRLIILLWLACANFTYTSLTFANTASATTCGQHNLLTQLPSTHQWQAIDGDTLRLNLRPNKSIRLNRINTTELGSHSKPDQPFAQAAKAEVNTFFSNDNTLYWQLGADPNDHHGRLLGSVYNAQGHWLAAHLVSQGLAFVVSYVADPAPNCLWQLESKAKQQQLGIWRSAISNTLKSSNAGYKDTGFQVLQGKVSKVNKTRYDWFVELEGQVVLRINQADWHKTNGSNPHLWLGKFIQTRGWLSWRKLSKSQHKKGFKPAIMVITHPDMVQVAY